MVMKKLLIGMVAVAALSTGSAYAADMPVKAPPRVEVESWTGFYIGLSSGARWSERTWETTCLNPTVPGAAAPCPNAGGFPGRFTFNNPASYNGGAFRSDIHAGYNAQVNNVWVVGLEVDGGYAWNRKTRPGIPGVDLPFGNFGSPADDQ